MDLLVRLSTQKKEGRRGIASYRKLLTIANRFRVLRIAHKAIWVTRSKLDILLLEAGRVLRIGGALHAIEDQSKRIDEKIDFTLRTHIKPNERQFSICFNKVGRSERKTFKKMTILETKREASAQRSILHFSDVTVVGRYPGLFDWNKKVFYIDKSIYDPVRHLCLEEIRGKAAIYRSTENRLYLYSRYLNNRKQPKELHGVYLSLFRECDQNFAHFVQECLSILAIAVESRINLDGIIANSLMHENFKFLLEIVCRFYGQKLIWLTSDQRVNIQKLVYISPLSRIPADIRHGDKDSILGYRYIDKDLAELLQRTIVPAVREELTGVHGVYAPKKVFLIRNSATVGNGRFIVNQDEWIAIALDLGYACLDAAEMNIAEQVLLLEKCEKLIVTMGASSSLSLFGKRYMDVLCLAPVYESANYDYFRQLFESNAGSVEFILGEQISSTGENADYIIPVDDRSLKSVKDFDRKRW